jgi:hypothetical protein
VNAEQMSDHVLPLVLDRTLAPIALFAYARPEHLSRTLSALRADPLAVRTALYVFCDAPRSPVAQSDCDAVRVLVRDLVGFASVQVVERSVNFGLARSIIDGVSAILQQYERVIVLEDDLEVSPHFLTYMNDALDLYADDDCVASVHGYVYPVGSPLPESFFMRGADCWGWGTWRRAWAQFNPDGQALLHALEAGKLTRAFDLDGCYPYTRMLRRQIEGRNNSWAIRWHASAFLLGWLTLYPGRSLVRNIGNDFSGTHSAVNRDFDVNLSPTPINLVRLPLEPSIDGEAAFEAYFRRTRWLPRRLIRHAWGVLVRVRQLLRRWII